MSSAMRKVLEGIASLTRSRAVLALVEVGLATLNGEPVNDGGDAPSPGALRQREYMRKKRQQVTSPVTGSDVTSDAANDASPLALSSLSISSDPSQASEIPTGSSMSTGAGATPEVTPDSHESRTQPVAKRARGSRVPASDAPDSDVSTWAWSNQIDTSHPEYAKFLDHWRAQPGQRGVKLDWGATWRNWIRRAPDFTPRGPSSGPTLPYHAPATPQRRTDGMRCELHGGEACKCEPWRLKQPSSEQGPVSLRRTK